MKGLRSHFTSLPLLLIGIALPATAGITSERPVSTPVSAAVTDIRGAAIASNGDQFLAVWTDRRHAGDTTGDIALFASPVDRDGNVFDPGGIFLAAHAYPASQEPSSPAVAWNGDAYVVVWSRSDGVVAARIAPDGTIVSPSRLVLKFQAIYDTTQLAANANVSVVTTSSGYVVLDHELLVINSGSLGSRPSVFPTGNDEFTLIASRDGLRLDSSGHLVSAATLAGNPAGKISCHGQDCIRVASNGTTSLLTVAVYNPVSQISADPLELQIHAQTFALVPTNSGHLLLTGDGTAQRFGLDGRTSGPPVPPCCPEKQDFIKDAASNGSDVAILRVSSMGLNVAIRTPSGEGAQHGLAVSANEQRQPVIAGSGSNYLVAWLENDGVYAGRLSLSGDPLDGRGLFVGGLPYTKPPYAFEAPGITATFDGMSYLVTTSTSRIYAGLPRSSITVTRIDPTTGDARSALPICGNDMRIASNGSTTVAVWADCRDGISAAMLDANGALASNPVTAGVVPAPQLWAVAHPSLAWNGAAWLVTWEEQYALISSSYAYYQTFAIRAARLSGALTLLDTQPIALTPPTQTLFSSSHLASDGHDFLAVWRDSTTIHTRPISASGVPSEDRTIAGVKSPQDLVWNGTSYSLAFASMDGNFAPVDLALMHLRSSGEPIDSQIISATPDEERSAALLPIGGGGALAAYTRVAHEALYGGVERVFVAIPHAARGHASRQEKP
jgi:hypothetical protein